MRTLDDLQAYFDSQPDDPAAEVRLHDHAAALSLKSDPPNLDSADLAESEHEPVIRLRPADRVVERSRRGWLLPAVAAAVIAAVVGTTLVRAHPWAGPTAQVQPAAEPTLVAAPATPAAAPFTLSLLPPGWKLLTWDKSHVSYSGPDRPANDKYLGLMGNIDVTYEQSAVDLSGAGNPDQVRTGPVTVGGGPVIVPQTSPGDGQTLIFAAGPGRAVVVLLPDTLHLSTADLTRFVAGITLRSSAVPQPN